MKSEMKFEIVTSWLSTATTQSEGTPSYKGLLPLEDKCAGWPDPWAGVHQPGPGRTTAAPTRCVM